MSRVFTSWLVIMYHENYVIAGPNMQGDQMGKQKLGAVRERQLLE